MGRKGVSKRKPKTKSKSASETMVSHNTVSSIPRTTDSAPAVSDVKGKEAPAASSGWNKAQKKHK